MSKKKYFLDTIKFSKAPWSYLNQPGRREGREEDGKEFNIRLTDYLPSLPSYRPLY